MLTAEELELGYGIDAMSGIPMAASSSIPTSHLWMLHVTIDVSLQGCNSLDQLSLLELNKGLEDGISLRRQAFIHKQFFGCFFILGTTGFD